jgi:hypothetical protein
MPLPSFADIVGGKQYSDMDLGKELTPVAPVDNVWSSNKTI